MSWSGRTSYPCGSPEPLHSSSRPPLISVNLRFVRLFVCKCLALDYFSSAYQLCAYHRQSPQCATIKPTTAARGPITPAVPRCLFHRINRPSVYSQSFIHSSAYGLLSPYGNVASGGSSARIQLVGVGIYKSYLTRASELRATSKSQQCLPWSRADIIPSPTHSVPPTGPNPNRPSPSEGVERKLSTLCAKTFLVTPAHHFGAINLGQNQSSAS